MAVLLGLVLFGFDQPGAMAQEEPAGFPRGTYSFTFENDRVVKTDRHYTNGVRLAWSSRPDALPRWAEWSWGRLPIWRPGGRRHAGVSVGQAMFTPDDIGERDLIPDDRPYAGWLYAGGSLINDTGQELQHLQLVLGIVGPASQADETQDLVHEILEVQRPEGWSNQLRNEPGAILYYEHKWRGVADLGVGGLQVAAMPHLVGAAGNIYTYGGAGLTLAFGTAVTNDWGQARIRPGIGGSDSLHPQDGFGWQVFAGVEGRAVARNIFLDGNTFRSSHSVDREPFVGDFQTGVALYYDRYRLAFTQILRTQEYREQDNADWFGSISISAVF